MQNFKGIQKLKQVLVSDKHLLSDNLNELLKSEIFKVLDNFLDVDIDNFFVELSVDEQGKYVLRCKARCSHIKVLGLLPKEG